jgi:inner membrane protein
VPLATLLSMDPISQAAIGAAAAQAGSKRTGLRTALWVGALGGALPDVDILIRSADDPLLFLDYHRHFTHSLAFIPFGGLIAAAVGRMLTRGKHTVRDLWLPATLGFATHGLLDSCTSYGTFLLWPFSTARIAWHNVAIIDPLFTLPVLIGAVLAAKRKNRILGRCAFIWGVAYLILGAVQRDRAEAIHAQIIAERGHHAARAEVKPSIGNNFLFRAFYEHDGTYQADAIRVPWWGEPTVYEGQSAEVLRVDDLVVGADPIHVEDLERFRVFSNSFLIQDPRHEGIISDFRYAAIPSAVAPLWGVDFGGAVPGKHLTFHRFNDVDKAARAQFTDQLLGR